MDRSAAHRRQREYAALLRVEHAARDVSRVLGPTPILDVALRELDEARWPEYSDATMAQEVGRL